MGLRIFFVSLVFAVSCRSSYQESTKSNDPITNDSVDRASSEEETVSEYERIALKLASASQELLDSGACKHEQPEGSLPDLSCEAARNYTTSTPAQTAAVLQDKQGVTAVNSEVAKSGGSNLTPWQIAGITMVCVGAVSVGVGAMGLRNFVNARKEFPMKRDINLFEYSYMRKLRQIETLKGERKTADAGRRTEIDAKIKNIQKSDPTNLSDQKIRTYENRSFKKGAISAFLVFAGLSTMSSGIGSALGLTGDDSSPFNTYTKRLADIYEKVE